MAVITVIGAGNGAHALAADCKLGGAEVRMFEFTRYNNKVKGILNSRRIRLEGLEMNYEHFKRSGTAVLDMVTYDMAEAVHGADHILISVQAQGFQQVFEELAPLLEDGQTVSIFPDNFGSLILRRIMKEKGIKTRVIVAGYDSLVYGARLVEYNNLETETDVVNITYRENEIRVDTLPSCDYDEYLKRCKEIPALDATELVHGDTALDISISNVNPLLHIPSVVMNTGAIENWGLVPNLGAPDVYYDIYAFGCSPAVGEVQYAYYEDLVKITKAFGVGICPVEKDALVSSRMGLIGQFFYGPDFRLPFTEPLNLNTWLPAPVGARFELKSRYITEDVPVGCVTAINFAKLFQLDTPVLHAMTGLSNIMMKTDYYQQGYTMKDLGLDGMSPAEMVAYMRTGETR